MYTSSFNHLPKYPFSINLFFFSSWMTKRPEIPFGYIDLFCLFNYERLPIVSITLIRMCNRTFSFISSVPKGFISKLLSDYLYEVPYLILKFRVFLEFLFVSVVDGLHNSYQTLGTFLRNRDSICIRSK